MVLTVYSKSDFINTNFRKKILITSVSFNFQKKIEIQIFLKHIRN